MSAEKASDFAAAWRVVGAEELTDGLATRAERLPWAGGPSGDVWRLVGPRPGDGLTLDLSPGISGAAMAQAWVLVDRGVASLGAAGDDGMHVEERSTTIGTWQLLRIDFDSSSARQLSILSGVADSEFIVTIPASAPLSNGMPGRLPPPPPVQRATVRGQIVEAGLPISIGRVVASARQLRSEVLLGEAQPSADGGYEIEYRWVGHRRPELLVRLVDDVGETLARGPIMHDPPVSAVIDLTVSPPAESAPEIIRLMRAIDPLLGGSSPGDLDGEDVAFLARATGWDAERVGHLMKAVRLANEASPETISPDVQPHMTPLLYALLRTPGWPARLESGRWTSQAIREAVETSISGGIVPAATTDGLDEAIDTLRRVAIDEVLTDPITGPLLELAVPDTTRRSIVEQYLEFEGSDSAFWDELASTPAGAEAVAAFRYGVRLTELTAHDLPLVRELFRRRRSGDDVGLETLAGYERDDWAELLAAVEEDERSLDRVDGGASTAERARELARSFELAFPSAAFTQRLARNSAAFGDDDVIDLVRQFPRVDLAVEDLDRVVGGDGIAEPAAVASGPAIKAIQRLFKVSPRHDHVSALHAAGYRSANAIARKGRAAFVRQMADPLGGETAAKDVFEQAAKISLAATGLYLDHGPSAKAPLPPALKPDTSAAIPDWVELFGDQMTFAGVEDCRTVFSPAAYLTDLLAYLDGRPSTLPGNTALDDLLSRRPDLQWLQLSCPNTQVAVPYIDLVNELLESAILAQPNLPRATEWLTGYPKLTAVTLPAGAIQTAGDEGWVTVSDPASPGSTVPNCHQSLPAVGEHHHGFQGATNQMSVQPGDLLVTWVYLDPDPPDQIMLEWAVGPDSEHRAYWSDLPAADPANIALGNDGTPSRWLMGGVPASGRWNRLVVPASTVALENAQVTGMRFLVSTAAGSATPPARGGAWWGSAGAVANAPPVETIGTSEALTTQPQSITTAAYTPLGSAVYPQQTLPFDLGIETARVALTQVNAPRFRVMETLHNGTRVAALLDVQVSAERLGLTPAEREIVSGTDGHLEAQHWGMTVDPAHPDQWFQDLVAAREFLRRSGLTLDEMRTRPGAVYAPGIGLAPSDPSDPSSLKVVGLTEASLPQVRRFLRLWRKLGWDHGALERVILNLGSPTTSGGPPQIDDSLLVTLALLERVEEMIGSSPLTTMSWWMPNLDGNGYVETAGYPADGPGRDTQSPYALTFLQPIGGEPNPAFRLNSARDELADPSQPLASQLPDVLAALRLSSTDLALLVGSELTGLPDGPGDMTTVRLNLGNLSALYRCATLAKTLDLAIPDFLALRFLTGINPFDGARRESTVLFAEATGDIRSSKLSLGELEYVLADTIAAGGDTVANAAQLDGLLSDLQTALIAIRDQQRPATPPPDATGQLTLSALSSVPAVTDAERAVAALNQTAVTTQPLATAPPDLGNASGGLLSYDQASGEVSLVVGAMTTAQQTTLNAVSTDADYHAAVGALFEASRSPVQSLLTELGLTAPTLDELIDQTTDPAARFASLLPHLQEIVTRLAGEHAIRDKVSAALGLDADLTSQLIRDWLHVTDTDGQQTSTLHALLALDDGQPISAHQPAHDGVVKSFKVARLIAALNLTRDEVTHAFTIGVRHGWLNLDALPLTPSSAPDFGGWQRLLNYVRLRGDLGDSAGALLRIFAAADAFTGGDPRAALDQALQQLNEAFGWRLDTLNDSVTALGLSYPADFVDERGVRRLRDLIAVADQVGATVAQLATLATNPLSAADGLASWKLTAAKYDPDTWTAVGAKLQNGLRERRRDALAAFVEANPQTLSLPDGQIDADRLVEWLLLDVEMGSCRPSARLDAAINSVQLYVQRSLLGLEPNVTLGDDDAAEWRWLGEYQTWQANRRVFVYPENWLAPTLRADVTPLFKQLQQTLLQADLTSDAAGTALAAYLSGLDQIANMEPTAITREIAVSLNWTTDPSTGQTTWTITETLGNEWHLVSRTRTLPHHYYYRTHPVDQPWTPWENISVDIDSDNLVPLFVDGHLYLFWVQLVDSADEKQAATVGVDGDKVPVRSRELRLAWTRLYRGQWEAKKVSPMSMNQGPDTYGLPLSSFFVQANIGLNLLFPTADITLDTNWYFGPSPSDPSAWLLEKTGAFKFSPGSLTLSATTAAPPALVTDVSITSQPGGNLPAGTYYYVVTVLFDGSQTAPSKEVSFASNGSQTPTLSWPGIGSASSYRVYRGSEPGGESQYYNVTPGGATTVTFRDVNGPPDGYGTPMALTTATPPQPGAVPEFQSLDLTDSSTLIVSVLTPSPISGQPPATSSVTALGRLHPSGDPGPSLALNHPGITGLFPLAGLMIQLGQRSFAVNQAPDIASVTVPFKFGAELAATTPTGRGASAEGDPAVAPGDVPTVRDVFERYLGARAPSVNGSQLLASVADQPPVTVRFAAAYHPFTKLLISALNEGGIPALLAREVQLQPADLASNIHPPLPKGTSGGAFDFSQYLPDPSVPAGTYPADVIDFSFDGLYSSYNWELFFHIPLLMARSLMTNRRFDEARQWLHYVFNPTDTSSAPAPQKYWQTAPLYNYASGAPDTSISTLLDLLVDPSADPGRKAIAEQEVALWRSRPFDTDVIARLRLSAYQKAVVMTYLDNLIAWGDDLFSAGTAETITQATQLYVLAAQLLGPRPDLGKAGAEVSPYSFAELRGREDSFSDPLVAAEDRLAVWSANPPASFEPAPVVTLAPILYFPVPVNDKLVGYWSKVEDRLSNIRHCLDIQGETATVPEFGAPIEPGVLVAGVFGSGIITGAQAVALPQYRFATLAQKAAELCGEVRSLGAAMLAAIEKRDAEELARIRSGQEVAVLQAARVVKQRQVDEAAEAIAVLQRSRDVTKARSDFYHGRPFLNAQETQQIGHLQTAAALQTVGQGFEVLGAALSLIPQFDIGVAGAFGSPLVNASFGGQQLAEVTQVYSRLLTLLASVESHQASMAGLMGGYSRRQDEWGFQAGQADLELKEIDAQITGAQIRQDIAQKELASHDLQIADAQSVDAFLASKFSNTELYEWMVTQISTVYFQTYQLALDLARRAERAYQHELAAYDARFIQVGYWNSLSKGLLAGEQLSFDLRRMEAAYLDANRREFELTKHVSVALTDPVALLQLKEGGECFLDVPEALFDLDYPGHYLRRLKSVAVTVPCVTGPFAGVNCTLTMLQNSVRTQIDTGPGYPRQGASDGRFVDQIAGAQTIVTSSGQSDSGMFETNLRDERFLPFEGAGAISRWHIRLPLDTNQFTRDSITDLVLHVRYTARDGGQALEDAAREAVVANAYKQGTRLLSLRQNLPDQWAQFALWASTPSAALTMQLPVTADLFPAQAPPGIGVVRFQLLIVTGVPLPSPSPTVSLQSPTAASADQLTLLANPSLADLPQAVKSYSTNQPLGAWTLGFPVPVAALNAVDIVLILDYAAG